MDMLKIRLRNGEKMVVNGAVLRAEGATTLWLESDAAVLRGREVMKPEEANTPARRLYFACMMAYLDPAKRPEHQTNIVTLLGELMGALEALGAKATCAAMACDVASGQFYRALAHCRALIDYEGAVLQEAARHTRN
jgi:flagellar biosynthesis repressor protein FlbT